jgi:hypothetical protein
VRQDPRQEWIAAASTLLSGGSRPSAKRVVISSVHRSGPGYSSGFGRRQHCAEPRHAEQCAIGEAMLKRHRCRDKPCADQSLGGTACRPFNLALRPLRRLPPSMSHQMKNPSASGKRVAHALKAFVNPAGQHEQCRVRHVNLARFPVALRPETEILQTKKLTTSRHWMG